MNALLTSFLTEPELYGFTNVETTCYGSGLTNPIKNTNSNYSMIRVASRINYAPRQGDCDGFLFVDPIHPASYAHQLMAEKVRELLDNAGIVLRD